MPSSSIATSFRTEKETIDRLDALASSLGRSRNWLVNEAVSDYLAYNEWFVEKVREGMDAATRGDFASDEEIDAVFRTYGAR
ncbi:MAG: ribbon-helix-helix domain-containing protein [Desulfovibrio sp.]|jgi:predicted transcriptional regulator|nr:ribbon-helix-helix domain-containing protein [Desulfovibrio sp.]